MEILLIREGFEHLYAERLAKIAVSQSPEIATKRLMCKEVMPCDDQEAETYSEVRTELGVNIYQLNGVLVKDLGYWDNDSSMVNLKRCIEEGEEDTSVLAHIIEIDSPGGQATFCDTLSAFIKNGVNKPIYAVVNGNCCSGAYWIASGCDKIYATENTDTFGSIGVMSSLTIDSDYMKKLGIERVQVYAPQSSEKNSVMKAALAGNIKPLQMEVLAPIADAFINTVKTNRAITDDSHVFKGKDYLTPDAIAINLIDGIKTIEQIKIEAFNEGLALYNQSKKDMTTHKLSAIAAAIGFTTDTFSADAQGNISLGVNEVLAIENALSAKASSQETAPVAAIQTPPATVTKEDVSSIVAEALKAQKTEFEAKIEAMKQAAVTAPVLAPNGGASDGTPPIDAKTAAAKDSVEIFG